MTERNPQVPGAAGMMVSFHNTVLNSLIHSTTHKDLLIKKKNPEKKNVHGFIHCKRDKWEFLKVN